MSPLLLAVSLALGLGGPPAEPPEEGGDSDRVVETIVDVDGEVRQVGAAGWSLVPDDDDGARYSPENLPDEFEIEGLAVTFSGDVLEMDPRVRHWGTPLRLTAIEARD